MDNFDEKQSVLSKEDLRDGADFICEFSDELKKFPGRLATSADETACARAIRNRLHDETDAKTRLEAFSTPKIAGRSSLALLGAWYALCYAIYFVSFAGDKLTGILVALLSLVLFLAGGTVCMLLYLGNRKACALMPKKVSYNVVSERARNDKDVKRTFIVCDSHDAVPGSPVKDFELMRKISLIIAPISVFIFVLFCILKMAIGTGAPNGAAKISAFTIFPFISGIFGISAMILQFSPKENCARVPNGISTAVAMATFAYFAEQPELMPEDVRIVYASFGAEEAGHGGSRAFVKAHPEFAGATVLCIGNVKGGGFRVAERDAIRNIDFSMDAVACAHASAIEQGISLSTLEHDSVMGRIGCMHGLLSNSFALNGMPSTALVAKDIAKAQKPTRKEIEQMFSLAVGTMTKLMAIKPQEVAVEQVAPSAEMEIKDVDCK